MIPTAIGLPTGTNRTPIYEAIQDWLQREGFGVYMPQRRYGDGDNISAEFNATTGGLNYQAATLAMLRTLPYAVLVHYGGYWYKDRAKDASGKYTANPNALNWPDPANPSGKRLTQDELTEKQLTAYLRQSYDYLIDEGCKRPIMLVDEPPHKGDDGKGGVTYGWSSTCEARICKMVRCAMAAGWTVAVAIPGPTQLAFWLGRGKFPTADGAPRLSPDIWILNDANVASAWPAEIVSGAKAGGKPEVWLYNAPSFTGLAFRMKQAGGSGYLHYQVEPKVKTHPLPDLVNVTSVKLADGSLQESYVVTADYYTLKAELLSLDIPVEPVPATWQEGYAMLNARLKAGGL